MRSAIAVERIFGEHLPEQVGSIVTTGETLLGESKRLRAKSNSPDSTIAAALWEIWIRDAMASIQRIGKRGRPAKGRG